MKMWFKILCEPKIMGVLLILVLKSLYIIGLHIIGLHFVIKYW